MTEFELKFQVPAERLAQVEAALRRAPVERTRLRARYYDTPLRSLVRHQLVLRLRQEGRDWVQAAKGPGRDGFERLEDEAPVADPQAPPDIRLHDAHPVGKLLRKALGDAAQELQPVFETDVTRLTRVVEAAGTSVEIALDQGRIRAGRHSHPVQELEFELKQGSAAAAVELAQRWCEEHGLWLDPLSKAAQGWRLAEGVQQPPPVQARSQDFEDGGASEWLASVIGSALEQVLGNARELASGLGGDEHIHQLRVGLRRLRTVLRELQGYAGLQALDPGVEPALRELFKLLGEHRDRATLLPALRHELEQAGAPALSAWEPPLPDVAAAIRAPAFQAALLQLLARVQELRAAPEPGSRKALRKAVAARLHKLHRQVLHAGRDFLALGETQRHGVRKHLKRLRYLAELACPLFARGAVDRFVEALKELQDDLGEYQDAATARALYTERAATEPAAWFAAGWLAARECEIAKACEQACRALREEAKPFWDEAR